MKVLIQQMQLDCSAVVCSGCLSEWITISASTECPCCVSHHNLTLQSIHPALDIIVRLLHDVVVQCVTCKRAMKSGEYDEHHCKQETAKVPIQMAKVIRHLTSENSSNIIQIPTVSILHAYNICVTSLMQPTYVHAL